MGGVDLGFFKVECVRLAEVGACSTARVTLSSPYFCAGRAEKGDVPGSRGWQPARPRRAGAGRSRGGLCGAGCGSIAPGLRLFVLLIACHMYSEASLGAQPLACARASAAVAPCYRVAFFKTLALLHAKSDHQCAARTWRAKRYELLQHGWQRSMGIFSCLFLSVRSAPCFRSSLTISTCPRIAAQCSAELSPWAQGAGVCLERGGAWPIDAGPESTACPVNPVPSAHRHHHIVISYHVDGVHVGALFEQELDRGQVAVVGRADQGRFPHLRRGASSVGGHASTAGRASDTTITATPPHNNTYHIALIDVGTFLDQQFAHGAVACGVAWVW